MFQMDIYLDIFNFPTSISPGAFSQRFAIYFGTLTSHTPREAFFKSKSLSIWVLDIVTDLRIAKKLLEATTDCH